MNGTEDSAPGGLVAIVTGSAGGIGAATALALSARGARVVVSDLRSGDEAQAVSRQCADLAGDSLCIQADVTVDAECKSLVARALERWGRVDALINNAAARRAVDFDALDDLTQDDFLSTYKVNVVGAFQMIRACVPQMRSQGSGAVVNVSSIAGSTGLGSSIAYAASKGALNTLTLSMARTLGPEIRVNAVCPGFVDTPFIRKALGDKGFSDAADAQKSTTPLRRLGTPEDIAEAIAFFATPASAHITGETLLSDAGMHLGFGR